VNILAIEISDSGLLVGDGGELREAGPGYALVEGARILVGDEARKRARLRPMEVRNRFWRDLGNTDPAGEGPAAADLACAQLKSIWEEQRDAGAEVIFVVPGYFARETLGLLLGIAAEAGIPARGLVDSSVAATTEAGGSRGLLHLDLHLHVAVLAPVAAVDRFRRGDVKLSEGLGLAAFEQAWIATIAGAFVRQTRFDPLHHAATEQILFDRLWPWLGSLDEQQELALEIEHDGRQLAASVTRRQILAAVEPQYERIVRLVESARASGEGDVLQLTHRVAALPGLQHRLREDTGMEPRSLSPGAAVEGAVSRSASILSPEGSIRFVTTLPFAGDAPAPEIAPPPAHEDGRNWPTHLLQGSVAHVISDAPLEVGISPPPGGRPVVIRDKVEGVSRNHCAVYRRGGGVVVEDRSRYGTFINGRRVDGSAEVRAGDVLRVGSPGSELLLIEARD
jgi:hypothetical protein